MSSKSFETEIELGGKTATGFAVPGNVIESLGQGKKPKVLVTINGHTYRSTVAVYAGVYMLPLNAINRQATRVQAGDRVTVSLALDTDKRSVTVPDELTTALTHSGLRAQFDALSYSKQRERAEAVGSAKRDATRERRIAKIIAELRGETSH